MELTPVAPFDNQDFYELHQAYRHAKHDPVKEYQAIIAYCEAQLNKVRAEAIKECNEFWSKKSDADYALIQKLYSDAKNARADALLEAAENMDNRGEPRITGILLRDMADEILNGEKK